MYSDSNLARVGGYSYPSTAGYDRNFAPAALLVKVKYSRMLVPDRIVKSVAYLGYKDDHGEFVPVGTGFFVATEREGHQFGTLVTAQHVVTDLEPKGGVWVRFNQKGGNKPLGIAPIPIQDWYFHPGAADRFIDVAAAPVSMPPTSDNEYLLFGHEGATSEVIQREAIGPGEEVAIAGYFRYAYGKFKNIPIVRIGNIAAMPDEPIQSKSGPIYAYLVEARSIGGLSGSPVFVSMAPWRIVNRQVQPTIKKPHMYLLGLMRGHYDVVTETDLDLSEDALRSAERMNAGVGIVIPFYEIWDTVMQAELEEQRQAVVDNLKKQGQGEIEDSAVPEDQGVEQRRDEILETMLNTPPDPKKSRQ